MRHQDVARANGAQGPLEQGRVAADGTYDDIIQRKDVPFASVLLSYQVTGESSPDTLPPVTAAAPPGKTATVAGKPERKSVAPAASGLGVQQEDKAMGNVSWATYRDYFRYGGGRMGASAFFPLMVRGNRINSRPPTPLLSNNKPRWAGPCGARQFIVAIPAVASVMSDWFLAYWSNNPPANVQEYMGIYGGLVGFVFISAIMRGLIFYRVSVLLLFQRCSAMCVPSHGPWERGPEDRSRLERRAASSRRCSQRSCACRRSSSCTTRTAAS